MFNFMRAAFLGLALLTLGGCENFQKLRQAYTVVTTKTVDPGYVIAGANSFDAVKILATQYLVYCKGRLDQAICSAPNRRSTIRWVRQGTNARNQLEGSIATNTPADSTIYNLMVAAITGLNDPVGPVAAFGAKQ